MPACRWCASPEVAVLLDLGDQPPADAFPRPGEVVTRTPLRLGRCGMCGLAQLLEDPGVREAPLGREPDALVRQARAAVAAVTAAGLTGPGRTFAEFDSPHGGGWRELLAGGGARDVTDDDEPADLVVDVFGLMHDADQRAAFQARRDRLAPGGVLAMQYQPLAGIVAGGQWNAVRHGHMAYYDDVPLAAALAELDLEVGPRWDFDLYGGTTLLTATMTGCPVVDPGPWTDVAPLVAAVDTSCQALREWLTAQRSAGRRVLGYGAASRTTPLLNRAGIGPALLPAVADAAPGKQGRVIPGVEVPVASVADLRERPPDRVVLFVADLLDEVRRTAPEVEASGGRWVTCEPAVHEVAPL